MHNAIRAEIGKLLSWTESSNDLRLGYVAKLMEVTPRIASTEVLYVCMYDSFHPPASVDGRYTGYHDWIYLSMFMHCALPCILCHPSSSFNLGYCTESYIFHIPLPSHSNRPSHGILKSRSSDCGLCQRPKTKRTDRIRRAHWRTSDDPPVDRFCLSVRPSQRYDQVREC